MKHKLGEICKFQSGGTPSKGCAEYFGGNIPWITTTALNGGTIDESNAVKWITERATKESAAKIVPAFSIMVGTRVGVGKVAVNVVDMSTSQDIISLIDIDERAWSKDFLCKFIQAKEKYLNSQARGATIKGIKIDVLAELKLPDISLEEQQYISQVIDTIKNIIAVRQDELQKLDELIKARFVEMFGDPITNTKHLGTKSLKDVLILKAGDFTVASDIADEFSETNPYPCYGGNGIRGYVSEYTQDGEYSLIGRQGALSGNVQFTSGKFKNTEHALLVTPIVEINNTWLNQLLVNLDLKRYQTGAAQPGLSVKNLQEIQIITVPIEEQNQFATFVAETAKSKSVVEKSLKETQILFDSLMQKYFG